MTTWVFNASPLILLGKINRLDLIEKLCPSFLIPTAVSLEILAGPDYDAAKIWIQNPAISARVVPDQPIPTEINAWDLGAGETAVISFASSLARLNPRRSRRPQLRRSIPTADDWHSRNPPQGQSGGICPADPTGDRAPHDCRFPPLPGGHSNGTQSRWRNPLRPVALSIPEVGTRK